MGSHAGALIWSPVLTDGIVTEEILGEFMTKKVPNEAVRVAFLLI
jgi:hypothetical protein